MHSLLTLFATSALGVALIASGALAHDPKPSPLARAAPRREIYLRVRDFSLIDQAGRPFDFGSLRGKVILIDFIYTSCPDVCPLMTVNMRKVQEGLEAAEKSSVYFLSITTDPEIDGPAILRSYAERYRVDFSNWSFLTGEPKALASVWKAFGVKVERVGKGLVSHTSLTGLIDPKGVMRFVYYGSAPDPKKILQDMRRLLAQDGG